MSVEEKKKIVGRARRSLAGPAASIDSALYNVTFCTGYLYDTIKYLQKVFPLVMQHISSPGETRTLAKLHDKQARPFQNKKTVSL